MRTPGETIEALVLLTRSGDAEAYAELVRRFQDMAVGYGYSLVGDFQLAEDAAQEAFFDAYRTLANLREPAAFPGWFRRIVFKQCDRITRARRSSIIELDEAEEQPFDGLSQAAALEQKEMNDKILQAVDSLPEHERATTMLFYIGGYSHKEVADFLDVPVSTVKKRLHAARGRLREMLLDLVQDTLREQRPSRDESFSLRVIDLLKAAREGDAEKVKLLLEQDPRLASARDPLGNTALILASNSGQTEIAELLLESGITPEIHEAAAIGRVDLVENYLNRDASLLDSFSPEGFTPLGLAAHFGHRRVAELLIKRGADVNAVSRHLMEVTPLHSALFGKKTTLAMLLIESGADVNLRRRGEGPRAGWTALHYAAANGFRQVVEAALLRGADLSIRDDAGRTALTIAIHEGRKKIEQRLREFGAEE